MIALIKNVRDIIALVLLIVVIPGLWILDALGALQLNGEVLGASIMAWGLVLQFYFRKQSSGEAS